MSQGLCPSCGAAVNLTAGTTETKCKYCDTVVTQQQAEAQFNEVKNSKCAGTLTIAETAQEGGSYSEALNYWNKVIEQEPGYADAWLNKGICMVRTSKIGDLKIPEAISSWKAAIKFGKNPEAMKKRVATVIAMTVSDFYPVLRQHYEKYKELENALSEHYDRFSILLSALSLAQEMDPQNEEVAEIGYRLCKGLSKSNEDDLGEDELTKKLDSLADSFLKVLREYNLEGHKAFYAKLESEKLERDAEAQAKAAIGNWFRKWICRILGPLGLLGGIASLMEALQGNQKSGDPGVGGSIALILFCAVMSLAWLPQLDKKKPSEAKKLE